MKNLTPMSWGYEAELVRISSGPYGGDIDSLKLEVFYQTEDMLRIRITDPNNPRWEVPDVVEQSSPPPENPLQLGYRVSFTDSPFGIAVVRNSNNEMIWNTTSPSQKNQFNGLIVSYWMVTENQYIIVTD